MNVYRKWLYLIIGVILGLGVGYALFGQKTALAPIQNPNGETKTTGSLTNYKLPVTKEAKTYFDLDTQLPGGVVLVKRVQMDEAGWLAVHDNNNDTPGKILGAYYLPAGEQTLVQVPLLRGIIDGETYYLTIHNDNGDRAFDHKIDVIRLTTQGDPELVRFSVEAQSTIGD